MLLREKRCVKLANKLRFYHLPYHRFLNRDATTKGGFQVPTFLLTLYNSK